MWLLVPAASSSAASAASASATDASSAASVCATNKGTASNKRMTISLPQDSAVYDADSFIDMVAKEGREDKEEAFTGDVHLPGAVSVSYL